MGDFIGMSADHGLPEEDGPRAGDDEACIKCGRPTGYAAGPFPDPFCRACETAAPICGWSDPGPGPDGATEDYACTAEAVGEWVLSLGTRTTTRHLCARHVGVVSGRGWTLAEVRGR